MAPILVAKVALQAALVLAVFAWVRPAQATRDPVGLILQNSFIWPDWVPEPTVAQAYVAFRQNFTLSATPTSALLHIFADARYWLWINGGYVLRGPCRFNPKRPEYDTGKSGRGA